MAINTKTRAVKDQYRRRSISFTWHTSTECPRWPLVGYVEDSPPSHFKLSMICFNCQKIAKNAEGQLRVSHN